jgi:hypothetical protein
MQEILLDLRDMLCFSIPEAIFITIMTYILLKKYNMLDKYKIKSTLINLLFPALISSIVLTLLGLLNIGLMAKIIGLLVFYLILLYLISSTSYQKIHWLGLKVLMSFITSFFIAMMIEYLSLLLLMTLIKIDPTKLMMNDEMFYTKLTTSLVWIVIEICLIFILYFKKDNKISYLLNIVFKNKKLLYFGIVLITINILLILEFIKLTLYNNIFVNTSINEQICVTLGIVLVLPLLTVLLMNFVVSALIKQQNYYEQLYHLK